MKIHKALLFVALLSLCLPAALIAQSAADTAAEAPSRELTPAEKKFQEAVGLAKAGNNAGAIRILEELRKSGTATEPSLSMLGGLYVNEGRPQEAMALLRPMATPEDADPAILYNAGKAALALGQIQEGQRYLERSVAKTPRSPASRELGLLLSRQGKVLEAYTYLRPWSVSDPDDLEVRIVAATLALRLERPNEAEIILSGLPEKEPAIRLLRAQARIQEGNAKAALALLQPIEKDHPAGVDLEVRRTLAEAHLLAGDPAAALKVLEGHTGNNHPSLVVLLARAQRLSGNPQAAMATLKPLVAQIPADPKTLGDPRPAAGVAMEYGRLLLDAKDVQGALPLLQRATSLYPSSQEAWQVYADALSAAGRPQDAGQARQKAKEIADAATQDHLAAMPAPAAPAAVTLSPNLQEAQRLMSAGQTDQALAAVRKEIAAAPGNAGARVMEVQLLLRLKRFPDALKAAEADLAADPKNPDFVYQRGAVQLALQHPAEAEKDLRRTLEMAPSHLPAMNDLAVVLASQNRITEARKLLEQVLALNPNDQKARNSLEQLKKIQGSKGGKG